MSKKDKLTDRQELFCKEYVIDLNATQAAIRAGYSQNTANEQGSQNLAKLSIQERLAELQKKRFERLEITADQVLREYAKIAFIDIRKFYDEEGNLKPIHKLDDDAAASLAGIDIDEIFEWIDGSKHNVGQTKKIKLQNKLAALEAISKHIGFFEKDNEQGNKIMMPVNNIILSKKNK